MDYKKIFSPETIAKLDKKSNDNLKQMLGDKNLIQTLQSSQKLLAEIAKAEAPYKSQLEKLAVNMVKELYPIIEQEGIVLDAKLVGMSEVGKELDEIRVNKPGDPIKQILDKYNLKYEESSFEDKNGKKHPEYLIKRPLTTLRINKNPFKNLWHISDKHTGAFKGMYDSPQELEQGLHKFFTLQESISPEGRRRIINSITQGSALRGAFAFYLFKEHLDEIDPSLVEKYNQIMKEVFGIYDDPNAVAMMLSLLAQGQKMAGGSSKVIIKEIKVNNPTKAIIFKDNKAKKPYTILNGKKIWGEYAPNNAVVLGNKLTNKLLDNLFKKQGTKMSLGYWIDDIDNKDVEIKIVENLQESTNSGITIKARAICFPMLVHELIKGLYELISLQGFKGDKKSNQDVVDKVDKLEHEPSDIKYGKFVYDALNNVFAASNYSDPRIREFFFIDVYKLDDDEFISFIENAINEKLTPIQLKWVETTLKEIEKDLKGDDYDATGIDEIKINQPGLKSPLKINSQEEWDKKYLPILKKKGYRWSYGGDLEDGKKLADSFPIFIYTSDEGLFGKSGKFIYIARNPQNLPTNLFEYSDKTVATTIERWKKENPKVDDNIAKQVIQRFDQIKNGLSQKLAIVSLSDELKQNNNYLNIDKYSFDDMVKLIRSLPENPDKIKKDAINKFYEKEQIDKATAQSYVARFMAKKDTLKHGVENGLEDLGFDKKDVVKLIPKQLQMNNAYLDPRNWRWEPFEQMLDALFPSQKQSGEVTNDVTTDADKVYNKGGIEIYKGDDVHKCISYNPKNVKKGDTNYGWCVTQPGNTNYDYYRFEERAPTFYFVFDRNKTSEPGSAPFKDKWHAFVIQVNADGKSYVVTAADNRGDEKASSWEAVSKIVPSDTWAKIKDLGSYFKPIALSPVERGRKFASGKSLSLSEFKELSQDEKIMYIQGKASKNAIGADILKILPKYKIDYEGRSTTLANVAIDSGQKFPYADLKDSEALAKRYAVFRFRHTNYSKEPIPLPYIKYLDEPAKEKYLKTFDDNLNFEYIEKFFGPKLAEEYVDKQIKNLDYLPPQAAKYIKDPKTKKLFEVYSKLFGSWKFGNDFGIDDKALETKSDMPVQDVTPIPINEKQWKDLSSEDRKIIMDLAGKVNKNNKYLTLLYALPFIIKDGDKTYVLVPEKNNDYSYNEWVLMDVNGKVIKNKISGDSTLGGTPLTSGYPDSSEEFNRIYDIKDLKIAK